MSVSARLRQLLPDKLINIPDISDEALDALFEALRTERGIEPVSPGGVAAAAFLQPSTRTLLSFQSAALRIGLPMLTLAGGTNSRMDDFYSESPEDVIHYMQSYCDLLVLRHFKAIDLTALARVNVPVINAGDGYNSHPTQALGDVASLLEAMNHDLDGARIGILGSAALRTVRSFLQLVRRVSSAEIFLLAEGNTVENAGRFELLTKEELLRECNVLYVSGLDHPDFSKPFTLPRDHGQKFLLEDSDLEIAPREIHIMHPGPKTHDIAPSLDESPLNLVWRQAQLATDARRILLGAYAAP